MTKVPNSPGLRQSVSLPPERRLTIYGRNPVAEALDDRSVGVLRLFVAEDARGAVIERILRVAKARRVSVKRLPAHEVSRISRHGRQDQGVAADIAAPGLVTVEDYLARPAPEPDRRLLVALDALTTQANVGMIIRSALAAGADALVMGRRGAAGLDPQVLKASAGTALRATILQGEDLVEMLTALAFAGLEIIGLDAEANETVFDTPNTGPAVLVIGSESTGFSDGIKPLIMRRLSIPMAGGVESLNAACAATVAVYAVLRAGR